MRIKSENRSSTLQLWAGRFLFFGLTKLKRCTPNYKAKALYSKLQSIDKSLYLNYDIFETDSFCFIIPSKILYRTIFYKYSRLKFFEEKL